MPGSSVCIDASFVVALVTPEAWSGKVLSLWEEWARGDVEIVAPSLLLCEVTSVLWRKVVRGLLDPGDARRAPEEVLALDSRILDPPDIFLQAFDLAARFGRPTAYDAQYLALAEMTGSEFWTLDGRLYNAVKGSSPGFVIPGRGNHFGTGKFWELLSAKFPGYLISVM